MYWNITERDVQVNTEKNKTNALDALLSSRNGTVVHIFDGEGNLLGQVKGWKTIYHFGIWVCANALRKAQITEKAFLNSLREMSLWFTKKRSDYRLAEASYRSEKMRGKYRDLPRESIQWKSIKATCKMISLMSSLYTPGSYPVSEAVRVLSCDVSRSELTKELERRLLKLLKSNK